MEIHITATKSEFMKNITPLLCFTVLTSLAGCSAGNIGAEFSSTSPTASQAGQLNGIWHSSSYGQLFKIDGDMFEAYDLTDTICVQIDPAEISLTDYYAQYRINTQNTEVLFSDIEEPYTYKFKRLNALPKQCVTTTADTPEGNFETFTSYFGAHYAFFELYNINWHDRVNEARRKISPEMTDAALYSLFQDMLTGLTDAHIEIIANLEGERDVFTANPGKTETALYERAISDGENPSHIKLDYRKKYWFDDIQTELLGGQGHMAGDTAIQYGLVSEDIGFIALMWMGGYVESDDETELSVLSAAMEDAMQRFKASNVKAVIIDLSINYGGYDYLAREVAGRFTESAQPSYSKVSANDPKAKPHTYTIQPSSGTRYTGPVYILTSDVTVSAAEILTIALRSMPNVTHAGEPTRGAFSDVLSRTLPNGWEISLSTEIYKDHQGVSWEKHGIEPELAVPVFNQANPLEGHLDAVHKVIAVIDGKYK